MNTAEIGAFIKNPQGLGLHQVHDLKNLCETHPYSGLLHLLYLKALGNAKSVDFDEELNNYAIKIPNRELLYHLIHEELEDIQLVENAATIEESVLEFSPERIALDIEENPVVEAPTLAVEVISEEKNAKEGVVYEEHDSEQQFEILENESATEELVELLVEEADDAPIALEEILETQFLVYDALDESKDETHEIVPQANVEVIVEQPVDSEDEHSFAENFVESPFEEVSWLDNTITFEGFADSLNYENDDLDESVEATEPISFDMQALLEGTISNETDLTEVTVELVPEAIDKPEEEITLDENQNSDQRKSFYDWLNVSPADSKTGNYEDVNKKMLQENQSTSPLKNEVEDIVFEQSESIPEKSKEKVQSLVDKFIEAEPRISRPKAEFFSPVKSAKESVSEEGIPVSETLAKIYELQGNYPKAIAVLEKLMELIPNKSETFATKITEIKSKMVG